MVSTPARLSHKSGIESIDDWVAELASHDPDLVLLYTYLKPAADLLLAAHEMDLQPELAGKLCALWTRFVPFRR